jgi:hypothetical protein
MVLDGRVVKNQSAISAQLTVLVPHGINKRFHHLDVECLINSAPFRHKFKVDDTPDVEKADQHCSDLGL